MIIFHEIGALQKHLSIQREKGCSIGFVPTMGALHEGHISLIRHAKAASTLTVCSIFVNPTQFNDIRDFEKYPITIEQDTRMLLAAGADILFLPAVKEMYPHGVQPNQHYDLGYLETVLEGAYRPGHFQGVCQVVHRLLQIVQPDMLVLGQKDYQQCMVLSRLVKQLSMPVQILIGETLREQNGLAMSSRNLRLSAEEKTRATAIYQALLHIKASIATQTLQQCCDEAAAILAQHGFTRIDYIAIADATTLALQNMDARWDGQTPLVALVAAFMGEVRLIDNMLLN